MSLRKFTPELTNIDEVMSLYKFLGITRLDFTVRDTGEVVKGYKVHFLEPAEHGIGYQPFSCFLNDERFLELFGQDLNSWKDPASRMASCELNFGRRKNLTGIKLVK